MKKTIYLIFVGNFESYPNYGETKLGKLIFGTIFDIIRDLLASLLLNIPSH
jgi:hypothetical protein